MDNWKQDIQEVGIIPVVKIENSEDALPLALALYEGGISLIEVTFRTKAAPDVIRIVRKEVPNMMVGAGTVLTLDQLDQALLAGAQFIVTPGLNPNIVKKAQELNIPIIPGVSSASEIEQALELGLDVLKFFPAVPMGGAATLKAWYGPYPNVTFIPTGGVTVENMNDFLKLPNVRAIGGSWMVDPKEIELKQFESIKDKTQQAIRTMVGLDFDHIGFSSTNLEQDLTHFEKLLNTSRKDHSKSSFVSERLELIKERHPNVLPQHLAYRVNDIKRAMRYFIHQGYEFDPSTSVFDAKGALKAIYFKQPIGAYSIHLIQK